MGERMIPFCQPSMNRPEYVAAVAHALCDNTIGPGEVCRELEGRLADYAGFRHCVLTNSATSGLWATAFSTEKRQKLGVAIPAYGIVANANAFKWCGLRPTLIDVSEETGCMVPRVERLSDCAAVCWVDFAACSTGRDMAQHIASAAGCYFWCDAAASLGRGKLVGDRAVYSFSGPKPVTAGQGGAVLTDDDIAADVMRNLVDQGPWYRTEGLCSGPGLNLRMADLQAALVLAQLDRLDDIMAERRAVFAVLKEAGALPLADPPYYYIIHVEDPEATKAKLERAGIPSRRYHRPIYHHPAYSNLGTPEQFPGAEYWWAHALYLPFGQGLTVEDAGHIADALS